MPDPVIDTEDFTDIYESPADSAVVSGEDAIYSALQANAPEVLIPIGTAHVCQSAVMQSVDGKDMSASFTILTRPKKTELNRGGRMVQIAPGPLGQGMKTENYKNNPVVLFNHGNDGFVFPLGLSQDKNGNCTIKSNARQMSGKVYFKQSCPYANSVFQMIDDGLLRMSSAGFSVEMMIPLDIDVSKLPSGVQTNSRYGYDVVQSDLMEWSVVPIGADAGALRQCVETGKWKGHVIRPQLIPVLRQYAEKPQAWGIGFGGGTIQQPQGTSVIATAMTFDADLFQKGMDANAKAIADLTQQISTLASNFATQPTQGTNLPAAQAIEPAVQTQQQQQPAIQTINVAGLTEQFGSLVQEAVAAALEPTRKAQSDLAERINQITGKLPD